MIKVYTVPEGHIHEYEQGDEENYSTHWQMVSRSDFDRAISLLKSANEAAKLLTDNIPSSNLPMKEFDKIEVLHRQTEEFLEECKDATGK